MANFITLSDLVSLVFKKLDTQCLVPSLFDIVWPEIRRMLHEEIQTLFAQGHKIIVAEAAVLLEAKWHEHDINEFYCLI
jgi:hypothetical protein